MSVSQVMLMGVRALSTGLIIVLAIAWVVLDRPAAALGFVASSTAQWTGGILPLWAVVLVSSVAFGLGHSYQGVSGMLRVTLIGLVFGAFYVLTGSIWLAMLAHTILDIAQGAIILEVLRNEHDQEAQRPADAH